MGYSPWDCRVRHDSAYKRCSAVSRFPVEVLAPCVAARSPCRQEEGCSEVSCHQGQLPGHSPSAVCVLSLASFSSHTLQCLSFVHTLETITIVS